MISTEIDCLVRKSVPEEAAKRFLGVRAADKLPRLEELHADEYLVANTDPSDKPGQHWVVFYMSRNGSLEFFDSYGNPVSDYPHLFSQSLAASVDVHNHFWFQAIGSDACGHYCVYYLYYRTRLPLMRDVLQKLLALTPSGPRDRDELVRHFVHMLARSRCVQFTTAASSCPTNSQCCVPRCGK